jgi:Zn-dependent protease with chaperone function
MFPLPTTIGKKEVILWTFSELLLLGFLLVLLGTSMLLLVFRISRRRSRKADDFSRLR